MTRASENARVYSQMILEAASRGDTLEKIMQSVGDDFHHRFGERLDKGDLEILVAGYVIYFKSKGTLS
jgi:hypothetical protein